MNPAYDQVVRGLLGSELTGLFGNQAMRVFCLNGLVDL